MGVGRSQCKCPFMKGESKNNTPPFPAKAIASQGHTRIGTSAALDVTTASLAGAPRSRCSAMRDRRAFEHRGHNEISSACHSPSGHRGQPFTSLILAKGIHMPCLGVRHLK